MTEDHGKTELALGDLDPTNSEPLYRQLYNKIRHAIISGRLVGGARLPSIRALAEDLKVSRNTVVHAYDGLAAEGYISSETGSGTRVRQTLPEDHMIANRTRGVLPPSRSFNALSLSSRGAKMVASASEALAEDPNPFMPDVPDTRRFPMSTWLRLMGEATGRLKRDLLTNVSNAGFDRLRRAIAQHVSIARDVRCDWEQVIVTTGTQQSLDLVIRLLLDRGDTVWVDEPAYVGARDAFKAGGAKLVYCPVDPSGMTVAENEETTPRLIFVCPSRQYPLGITMSQERRDQLSKVVREGKCWLVEDDYDCEFRYEGTPTPALQPNDPEATIYIGTFSKSCLPSFRLGFIIVPKGLSPAFARARALIDRHAPIMEQLAMAEFIEHGHYATHLRRMRELYYRRQIALIEALSDETGGALSIPIQSNGTNLILWLRSGKSDIAASEIARKQGVFARPVSIYFDHECPRQGLILGYAAYTVEEIANNAKRLLDALPFEAWFDPNQELFVQASTN